jgi:hypothetical protein
MQLESSKFKEICLNDDKKQENVKLLEEFLKDFFNPDIKLNINGVNNASNIIYYIRGGLDFEDFKTKSNFIQIFFRIIKSILFN